MRLIFFGSSQNVFSGRFYQALRESGLRDRRRGGRAARRNGRPPIPRGTPPWPISPGTRVGRGLPVFDPPDPNAPEFVAALRGLRPDLFLAVGYMLRLGRRSWPFPESSPPTCTPRSCPAYRGRSPVFWAVRNGERYSGLTIHAMDERLDTGDLLYQVRVRTRRDDTVASLYDRVIAKGLSLVPRLIADARRGRLPRKAQPAEGGSYYSAAKEVRFPHRLVPGRRDLETLDYDHAGQVLHTLRGEPATS